MTNTKFRKKALLSSVAMLIVALIALGSATFAWYQASLNVDTTGMTFTTNSASGLQIVSASTANGGAYIAQIANDSALTNVTYGTTATFNSAEDKELQPASFNQTIDDGGNPAKVTGAFYKTNGSGPSEGGIADGATISPSSDYIEEYVYFKIADSGSTKFGHVELTGCDITVPGANDNPTARTMASAIRVVVYKMDGSFAAEFGPSGTSGKQAYLTGATPYDEDYASTYIKSGDNGKVVNVGTLATPIDVGTVTKSKKVSQGLCVRVYLDGFDQYITSDNAVQVGGIDTTEAPHADDILKGISLKFTMTGAQDTLPD